MPWSSMRSSIRVLAVVLAGLSLADHAPADQLRVTVVAKSGDPAPFAGPGVTWSGFRVGQSATYISPAGEIVAAGVLAGVGVTPDNENVLVVGRPGQLRIVAREGDALPDLPAGVVIDQTPFGLISPGGRVLIAVALRGPGVSAANDVAVLLAPATGSAEPARLVLREGEQAPELPAGVNIFVMDLTSVSISDEPRVAISATLSGPGITSANGQAMYRSNPDSPHIPRLVARAGDPAPALGAGLSYGAVAAPMLRPNGDIVATIGRAGPGITAGNDRTISIVPAGSTTPTPLFVEGEPVPGRPGTVLTALGIALLTGPDRLAFHATFNENSTSRQSLWSVDLNAPGSPRPIAVSGDPAPGLPAGAAYASINGAKYDVSADGRGAFVATLIDGGTSAANDSVIWSEGPAGAALARAVGREGSPAPDVFPPAALGSMTTGSVNVAINTRSQTAWVAPIEPGGDAGFFFTDAAGVTRHLAREGGPFELAPGDTRTVDQISGPVLQAGQSPWRRWFNDAGQTAVIMSFAGTPASSTLVLAELDPVPTCRADFNGDGNDTLQDLFDFLSAWFARHPAADVNGVDGVTVQDLFDFLGFWFAGCP